MCVVFQAEDGIRYLVRSRGLGDVYKRQALRERFGLTQVQAQAILDMQLRRLAALERQKIEDEYQEIMARIAYYLDLLLSLIHI